MRKSEISEVMSTIAFLAWELFALGCVILFFLGVFVLMVASAGA